ncbi:MAG: TonB-dependent receptor domain-containing protein, partial [Candidatus Zixiibacteriota bacterium]
MMLCRCRFHVSLVFILALCVLFLPTETHSAATGQIKGTIVDKETGEPVVGASVIVVGTNRGAMTDLDGNYIITQMEPGKYTIRITSIQYREVEITDVEVKSDLSTVVSQKLQKKVTELEKKIVVTAKRDPIERVITSNQRTITKEVIEVQPVTTVDELLTQVAGVVTGREGEIFIRGGRAGEVSYILDGVPIDDPLAGLGQAGASLSLVSGSIQEFTVIKDGFDPEYGDAVSGIIKITTRTGSKDNTNMNFQFITDDFGNKDLNKYSRNNDFVRFSLSGPDPVLTSKVLPALGLNFMQDKEFTYYFYAEVDKSDGFYQYERYDSPITRRPYGYFNIFGFKIPERLENNYHWMTNLKFRPRQNLKLILSYKDRQVKRTAFSWAYRYSAATAPVINQDFRSLSLEVLHAISKDMNYELILSFTKNATSQKPGDPNNPGHGLDPPDFPFDYETETYIDNNGNGVYDPPEPFINVYPDTISYGTDFTGPKYTYGEYLYDENIQGGTGGVSGFRFNNNGMRDSIEGEPFIDWNNNGVWDRGDFLNDVNGNGILDQDRRQVINQRTPEPYIDGDSVIGEPFIDVNDNRVYDFGVDIFTKCVCPDNMDLNHNGVYDGPNDLWTPGIPYVDRNGNGLYDFPNNQYDFGEPFTDVNGNGRYDQGGGSHFYDPLTYDEDATWHYRRTYTYRGELKVFRELGPHQLKAGVAIERMDFIYQLIEKPYILYTGRSDGGPYPDRGAFRDMFDYFPWQGTVYFRDKLEYGSMIASLGMRWDFFIQDKEKLVPVAKNDDLGSGIILGDRQKISPRIGFSYPISDKAKVHFNYGHFYQMPSLAAMYARNTAAVDQNTIIGNYNLDYIKTVQYSFGVKYAMSENYSLDISGYFKDEFDKINAFNVRVGGLERQQYRNSDYGRSRGFEITLDKTGGGYVNGSLWYSYAFAYGKASEEARKWQDPTQILKEPLSEAPLNNDIR